MSDNLSAEVPEEEASEPADDTAREGTPTAREEEDAQYGVGPFTVREVAILATWLVAFVVSFFPVYAPYGGSIWTTGIEWLLMIGVPTAAVFLLVLRRFSPQGIRRVGSLGIDQFASVAASVAAVLWLNLAWLTVVTAVTAGAWITTWVVWVELVATLALVFFTVFAPFVPPFAEDFRGRPEEIAHPNARPVRRVIPRPAPVFNGDAVEAQPGTYAPPAAEASAYAPAEMGAFVASSGGYDATQDTGGYAPAQETGGYAPVGDYAPPADAGAAQTEGFEEWAAPAPAYARSGYPASGDGVDEPASESAAFELAASEPAASEPATAEPTVSHQPFWALVPVERDVVEEHTGAPLFRIGPTAWALVIADRGSSFLVRHDDGRVGVLYDVSGVTRG